MNTTRLRLFGTLLLALALVACGAGDDTGQPNTIVEEESIFPGTNQRFAPGIAFAVNFATASAQARGVNAIDKLWDTWVADYYTDWLDPAERTTMYLFGSNYQIEDLFTDATQAPESIGALVDPDYAPSGIAFYNWSVIDAYLNAAPVTSGVAKLIVRFFWEQNHTPAFINDILEPNDSLCSSLHFPLYF